MLDDFSPNPEGPVLVIGGAAVDIVGSLTEDLHMGISNPSRIRRSYGGVARNLAENISRLGHPVKLLTVVGDDDAGDNLIDQASEAGIDTSSILVSQEAPTGSYLAVVDKKGVLQVALDDMRVIKSITAEYVQAQSQLFKDASMVFLDANLSRSSIRKAISLARRAHIPICADPTASKLAHRFIQHLPKLNLITPNCYEAGVLCDKQVDPSNQEEALGIAKCLVGKGTDIVVITLAQFGVCYATSETSGQVPAILTEIVDPTGGGDAFSAALIFGLLNEIPLDDAIRLGVSAATLTLRYPGAVLPDLTLEKLYGQLVI
jgi:pseudouridine kinase